QLEGEMEGFIPMSELSARRISRPEEAVTVGQTVEATVIDTRDRRIVLSLRQAEQQQNRQNYDSYRQRSQSQSQNEVGRMTIGELIGDKLSALSKSLAAEAAAEEIASAPLVAAAPQEPAAVDLLAEAAPEVSAAAP